MTNADSPRLGGRRRRRSRLAIAAVAVVIVCYFVVAPALTAAWEKTAHTPPPPIDTGSLRSDSFVPSRVVEYDALIGLSVPEALQLLDYREGRNLYPVEPILVPTPSLGPAAPSQDDQKDLVVTGVCQTMTPERAFGENPRIEVSDRIYLSTYPRSKLSPEQRTALPHPQSTDERAWVEGFTVALKDQEKRCDPSIGSIAVR